jgi:hypothetical protein
MAWIFCGVGYFQQRLFFKTWWVCEAARWGWPHALPVLRCTVPVLLAICAVEQEAAILRALALANCEFAQGPANP